MKWNRVGIKKKADYGILTNEITKAWSDMSVAEYKELKDLKKENLRDNMSNLELVLNMLGEVTTTEISKDRNPKEFSESKSIAKEGGGVAGETRRNTENKLGRSVITKKNNLGIKPRQKLK